MSNQINSINQKLCTTAFLVEISQYIKFGDLSIYEDAPPVVSDTEPALPSAIPLSLPMLSFDRMYELEQGAEPRLSNDEEDALLKDSTGSFADWVASFIRRVIQLLENLPEESANGSAGGASEGFSFTTLLSFSSNLRVQFKWSTQSQEHVVKYVSTYRNRSSTWY
jgi:proteasome activator subunit 4